MTILAFCFAPNTLKDLLAEELFRDKVAPILQRRCVSCHNDQQSKGGFSLQSSEAAMEAGYIEPGDAKASPLLDLITADGGKAEMPKDADPLSEAEVQIIGDWILAGAHWPSDIQLSEALVDDFDWWSFRPVERPRVPQTESDWARTAIDAFVLKQLDDQGLTYSTEADRRTLIRRLSYDIIGLPPTPAEVAAFQADPDPRAYEKLVDRLLDSPHYGEHWARHWLDVVKYADTCGYDKDKLRPNAWPYRDYVIQSLNQAKPYARFVQEQIAGDELFPGEPDGILGLGFIAAGPWDFIGHVEVAASKSDGMVARNLDRDDMVSNVLNTFCSVTIQCARCHNHKFDPFTQEHYYGLQSIFAAVDRAERPYDVDPQVQADRRRIDTELKQYKNELAAVQTTINDAGGPRLIELQENAAELKRQQGVRKSPEFGYHSAIAAKQESTKWVEVVLNSPSHVSRVILHACHDDFAGIGAGFGFPLRFKIEVSQQIEGAESTWTNIADFTDQDYPNPGLAPVEIRCDVNQVRRVRITANKLATRKDDYIFALAELEVVSTEVGDISSLPAVRSQGKSQAESFSHVRALDSVEAPVRWQKNNLIDGTWAVAEDPGAAERLRQVRSELQTLMAKIESPEMISRREKLRRRIAKTEATSQLFPKGKMVYAAATHFAAQGNFRPTEGQLRPIHLLLRGEVASRGDKVAPSVLPLRAGADPQLNAKLTESQRRAALARWLTQKDHPLVWRSIVNRIWQYHFGNGLVATPNDFGRMGATPTHPKLLDWLASEFRDGDQSLKTLHRLIVTSSVYRQSSEHHAGNAAIDGSNRFLWRMNRRRLSAEEIRDSILAVSASLDRTAGGPGFYLFELEHPQHSPHYYYHKFDPADPASHRRSIYRFIVRSQPNPWMTTLDCADSSQSTPRRDETLTSLQALSLLNNRFNLVMAERFAEHLQQESDEPHVQVALAIQTLIQRTGSPEERQAFTEYTRRHGLANLCRFLFNLSEFLYLD